MLKIDRIYKQRFNVDFDTILNGWFSELLTTQKIEAYLKLRYHLLEQSEAMENIINRLK